MIKREAAASMGTLQPDPDTEPGPSKKQKTESAADEDLKRFYRSWAWKREHRYVVNAIYTVLTPGCVLVGLCLTGQPELASIPACWHHWWCMWVGQRLHRSHSNTKTWLLRIMGRLGFHNPEACCADGAMLFAVQARQR